MKRKTIYIMVATAIAALSLTSCIKDTLYHTPHPDKGCVMVSADFSARSASADAPAEYMLRCGTATPYTMPSAKEANYPEFLLPANYTFTAWNRCAKMSEADGTISVERNASGEIEPMPGYLFTARHEAEVIKDDTLRIALPMAQRTRDVQFELTVTEGNPELIASVGGTLSGIAAAFSLAEQNVAGNAATTRIAFVREGDKIKAAARLLGVIGTAQSLELEVRFTDRADIHRATVDLSAALARFDDDMTTTRMITGDLATPIGMDLTATITDWKNIKGDADAELQ